MPTEFPIIIKPTTRTATKQPTATSPHFFTALSRPQPRTISQCSEYQQILRYVCSHTLFVIIRNNFIPKGIRNKDRERNSDMVSINIYAQRKSQRESQDRGRLQEIVSYESNRCFPYLITMKLKELVNVYNLSMVLDKEYDFPSCDFWNINVSYWDTKG